MPRRFRIQAGARPLLREKSARKIWSKCFLKMVAIGTIADIMHSPRKTARSRDRLKDLPKASNYGLKALMEVADLQCEIDELRIGFRIAPRINPPENGRSFDRYQGFLSRNFF